MQNLKKLPEQFNLIALEQEEENLTAKNDHNKEQIKSLQRDQKKLEDYAQKNLDQIKTLEQKLYGGSVQNAKELNQINLKVEQLKKEVSDSEEKILNLMLELEEAGAIDQQVSHELVTAQQKFQKAQATFQQQKTKLDNQLEKLQQEVSEIQQKVDPELLDYYQSIARRKGGIGIAKVEDSNCTGCQVKLSAVLWEKTQGGGELLTCESCGRLLYVQKK